MKSLFSTDGIIYKIMTMAYRLVILNLLWCVSCIPVITVGASTTALFYVVGKIVRNEEVHEIRDFVKGFRESFRQATCVWLILCAAYIVIFTNLSFLSQYDSLSGLMLVIQLPVLVQVVIISVFVFPLLSRYEAGTLAIIKASWILGIKHILSCIASLAIVAVAVLLARLAPALFLMVFASVVALGIYMVFNNVLEKYHPDAENRSGVLL